MDDTQLSIFCRICRQPPLKFQHLAPHKTSLQSSSHWDGNETTFGKPTGVITALPLREHLQLLASAIHFICCLLLGSRPRDLPGVPSQDPPATEGDLRESGWGKESSIPGRYFLYQLHTFGMDWWTSYLLQENKLVPQVSATMKWTWKLLPQASPSSLGISICLVLALHPAKGTGWCQENFCLCVPRMGSGRWAPKDHAISGGALATEFALSHSLPVFGGF